MLCTRWYYNLSSRYVSGAASFGRICTQSDLNITLDKFWKCFGNISVYFSMGWLRQIERNQIYTHTGHLYLKVLFEKYCRTTCQKIKQKSINYWWTWPGVRLTKATHVMTIYFDKMYLSKVGSIVQFGFVFPRPHSCPECAGWTRPVTLDGGVTGWSETVPGIF